MCGVAQPRAALAGLAQLPCWKAPETMAATGGALPAFSAYPQARITSCFHRLLCYLLDKDFCTNSTGPLRDA